MNTTKWDLLEKFELFVSKLTYEEMSLLTTMITNDWDSLIHRVNHVYFDKQGENYG